MTNTTKTTSKLPYHQAMEAVEKRISAGTYSPGQKLPPIKSLSNELGMNYLTVRKAIHKLAEKGIVEVHHGLGTFVSDRTAHLTIKTLRIGLAFRSYMFEQDEQHSAIGSYLAGAHRRLQVPEFSLQTLAYRKNMFSQDLAQTIVSQEMDGMIVLGGSLQQEDFELLRNHDIPTVGILCPECAGQGISTVEVDRNLGMSQAVDYLRNLGHQQIGFISYEDTNDGGLLNRHYANLAFSHRLGDPRKLLLEVRNPDGMTHWEDVEEFFEIESRPSAVIVRDEYLADVLLDGCQRNGIRVPEDLSIIALQDAKPYGHRVPLTTAEEVSGLSNRMYAACNLLARIIGGQTKTEHIVLEPKLVVKASTAVFQAKHP